MPRKATRVFPIMLSVSELAAALSVTRREVYEAHAAGYLPIYKRGPRKRVLIEDAVKWVRATWRLVP